MAGDVEAYRAQVTFRHKFENVAQKLRRFSDIDSPNFFARNIPFYLTLSIGHHQAISCYLFCETEFEEGFSCNLQLHYSLILPSKTVKSEEYSLTITHGDDCYKAILSEVFPGQELFVDDALTLEVSILADEPKGMLEYKPPKEKLRQELQLGENQSLAESFGSLLDSGDFSDVTFVTSHDSSKVQAHKTILGARSPVFATMLTTDMAEARDSEIKIDDMGAPALKIMLRYIYTGQLGFPNGVKVDLKLCMELANAGEKYDLQNLKEYASMAMTEFVSLENAWELLSFAKRLGAGAATKALTSYYVDNVHKIIENL